MRLCRPDATAPLRRSIYLLLAVMCFLIPGCGGLNLIAPSSLSTEPAWTLTPSLTPFQPVSVTVTLPGTDTAIPWPTETALPTLTFTPTPTPQWYLQGPGEVVVPILLYHHIGLSHSDTTYYVSPQAFEQQMELLHQWGYQTISVEMLVRAIQQGAILPPKPIILTFDDGSETTYTDALPILQQYDFTGVSYIVYDYIGVKNYMDADEIRTLYANGWEIGSHSLSHTDLTARSAHQMEEIIESRKRLQALLGVPVMSFAYPFGAYDKDSVAYVHSAGYVAAMGLGNKASQNDKNLFYLSRQAILGMDDLRSFALRLPWREDLDNLPAMTIVP